ncbi:acyl-CoA dehydrogenase family protein [Pseudomonas sp. LS44]|uniref:acyl-CoA dehydrogenase family protein n=1 Tax=Pseudomonas sp. LS44 TaxID=1357074 RepID=UPI00215AD4A2|nr:acyl-CoA dehydrogenase family protein [Pseudomonas sp. LS44]UVE16010.1 acyl-CoA dehydrogenase family protein [Pseudomonas sp. LS44]
MRVENYRSPWEDADLTAFRDSIRRFIREQLLPHEDKWRAQKRTDRSAWLACGEMGMILPDMPSEYGGVDGTPAHYAVATEELIYAGATSIALSVSHVVGHYILGSGTEAQKREWLPKIASGECITSIAMTEPGTGSDLQGVRTRAVKKGDKYVISGSKTFISNGQNSDMAVVIAKTDLEAKGSKGISLFIVDTKTPGFQRGKCLDKVGLPGQDTSEMFFEDCEVSADCLIGGVEGQGFIQLMQQLPYERADIAIQAAASLERALALTVDYTKERKAFGKSILDFQNTRFTLAEVKATVLASRLFADLVVQRWVDGTLDSTLASMGKFWLTDRQGEVIDTCLQFFGGFGYMNEYPIARMFSDSRVARIYGGANEIQRELVGRSL